MSDPRPSSSSSLSASQPLSDGLEEIECLWVVMCSMDWGKDLAPKFPQIKGDLEAYGRDLCASDARLFRDWVTARGESKRVVNAWSKAILKGCAVPDEQLERDCSDRFAFFLLFQTYAGFLAGGVDVVTRAWLSSLTEIERLALSNYHSMEGKALAEFTQNTYALIMNHSGRKPEGK